MRTGRIVKASNSKFIKMVNVPKEVIEFFERLQSEYKNSEFIVDIDPNTYKEGTEASVEIEIYDYYVE